MSDEVDGVMSLVSLRTARPFAGKAALAVERAHTLGGIYTRNGGRVRVGRVIAGDGAGQIYFGVAFDDGKSMGQIFEKVQADPSFVKLTEEAELDPAASVSGPEVYRFLYGQPGPSHPINLYREYTMSREKVADALALMPELDALLKDYDIRLTITVPVFSSDMARFIANYRYQSPAHLGEAIDGVLASAEFQAIVNRAAALGSLTRSRVVNFM
jgi:hypothetical protein